MSVQHRVLSLVAVGSIVASVAATRHAAAGAPAACSLLTAAEASTALGAPSRAGKEFMSPAACMWSNDPAASDTSRRVALVTHSVMAFNIAKKPAISTVTVEPAPGIGDEAFYQIYPRGQNVFIWVRKGNVAISINILTREDPRPFTDDQKKARVAVLAKAAVGRL